MTSGVPAVSFHASMTPASAPSRAVAATFLSPVLLRFHWYELIGSLNGMLLDAGDEFSLAWGLNGMLLQSEANFGTELNWIARISGCTATFSAKDLIGVSSSKVTINHLCRPSSRATSSFLGLWLRAFSKLMYSAFPNSSSAMSSPFS